MSNEWFIWTTFTNLGLLKISFEKVLDFVDLIWVESELVKSW